MNRYTYLLVLLMGLFVACKKEIPTPPRPPKPVTLTDADRLRAQIYDYYNKYSLWTESIPDLNEADRLAFVRQYGSNQSVLNALRNMTPNFSYRPYDYLGVAVGNHYDRYSFLDESATGAASSRAGVELQMDATEGYGLYFGWGMLASDGFARPVISFVEGGSPAQKAGLRRGMIVYELNGEEPTARVAADGSVNAQDDQKFQQKLTGNVLVLRMKTIEHLNEEPQDFTIRYADSYTINPVMKDTVYAYPTKSVAYLAYSSFEEAYLGYGTDWDRMEAIFDRFETAAVKDLILDLRYNTGGYVETARYLANKLVPSAANGQVMFSYEVNDYLKPYTQTPSSDFDFRPVHFKKQNHLELQHLYVLVSEQTASAAELLVNSLRPHMDLTLIGDTDRTYGKPVGFFPEEIEDVTLWVTSFKTLNSAGETDYWNGLPFKPTDISDGNDYFFKDFGDSSEDMIAVALDKAGVKPKTKLQAIVRKAQLSPQAKGLGLINKLPQRNMRKVR